MKDTHITLTDTLSERLAAILNQVQRLLLKSDWTGELIQTEPCGKARWERRRRKAACRGSAGTNSKKRRWNMCRKKKKNTYFSCSFSFLFVLQLTFSLCHLCFPFGISLSFLSLLFLNDSYFLLVTFHVCVHTLFQKCYTSELNGKKSSWMSKLI